MGKQSVRRQSDQVNDPSLRPQLRTRTSSASERAANQRIQRLERRPAEEEAVYKDQHRLLSRANLEWVAEALLDVAPKLAPAEFYRMMVRREDGGWQCWERKDSGEIHRYELGPETELPSEVIEDWRPVLIRQWPRAHGPKIELASRIKLRSYMALPMITEDRLIGVFEAANFAHPGKIEEYARLLDDMVAPAATAIEVVWLHEELRHRAHELSRVLRNLEDFTRAVSHDLRTPLSIVLGQAQLAQRSLAAGQKDATARSLEAIVTSARRINNMIEDLVDMSRLEVGRIELHREHVDLPSFVEDLLHRMAPVADVSRIEIVRPRQPLPKVLADPDRLERIMTNLLTNALKYSEGKITVSFEQQDGYVVTSVTDRGVGIEPEDLPHIFERYYRAKGVRKSEGLGLGLAITRMLVEIQGGKIWVKSKPGEGATFSFSLPIG